MNVGIGFDIHRLIKGRPLVLGGVEIPHSKGLAGHSDADALIHALIDALLGAMGSGDIGDKFPDTDPRYKDISSMVLLETVLKEMRKKRFRVRHVDTILMLEEPKLLPYKDKIRASLAKMLDVAGSQVNVKAKTMEGLDAVGEKRAISCFCVASLNKL